MKPTSKTEADLDNIVGIFLGLIGIFLGLIITAIMFVIGTYIMDQVITSTPIFSTQLDEIQKTTTAAFTIAPLAILVGVVAGAVWIIPRLFGLPKIFHQYIASPNIILKESISSRPEIDKPKSRAQLIEETCRSY